MPSQTLISFLAYFCVLLTIGLLAHRKQKSSADFILGNRSLNFWLTALSAHASDMSGWLFMAFPAAIFAGGLSQSWVGLGLVVGMLFNWQFVAKRLRILTEKYDSYTLSTFFEKRYGDESGFIRLLTAIISLFFLVCYLAAGLITMGLLFVSVFQIDYYLGLSVATLVVMTYTLAGGFLTVAWTDLFQALFLMSVIVIVPFIAFLTLPDGFTTIEAVASAKNLNLSFFNEHSMENYLTITFLIFSWGLGYFGQPHIITKFMGIKDPNEMTKSKYVGMTWQVITLISAAFIAIVGIGFFQDGLHNPQLVFVEMVKTLFNPLLAGFILCGLLAASMSTMDSQILVCASVFSEDLYKKILRPEATDSEILKASRCGVVLSTLIALVLAFNKSPTVLEAVLYAWSGLGASFGPLVIMSLYSETSNRFGAIVGILVGGIISATWDVLNPYIINYKIPAMIPAFFLSLASIYIVSIATSKWSSRSGGVNYP